MTPADPQPANPYIQPDPSKAPSSLTPSSLTPSQVQNRPTLGQRIAGDVPRLRK